MGRKRTIEHEELIKLIDSYYLEVCAGRANLIKRSALVKYIQEHGYPDFMDYTLKNDKTAVAYIKGLKEKETRQLTTLVAYKPLNVQKLLRDNPTQAQLIVALTQYSNYYKDVAESAVTVFKEQKKYEEQIVSLGKELDAKNLELARTKNQLAEMRDANAALTDERDKYKAVIDKYVYPEIAADLLREAGVALQPSEHIHDPEILRKDNVIPISEFLLRRFGEDESI